MKNRFVQFTAAAFVVLLGLTGCDDSILNETPKDQLSDATVFADPNLANAFLNDIYIGMGNGYEEMLLASISDETQFVHARGTDDVLKSIISASNRGAIGNDNFNRFDWYDNYFRIRQTNVFLKQIWDAKFDEANKRAMAGQAHFLRAYFYHNLMRAFGGVPLVTRVYSLNEDYEVSRNTFEETVNFIVADADSAAELLPLNMTGDNVGRATKGAAMALKSRVLLYAASDLYHRNPKQAENGYVNGADRTAMWRAAKNAAKAVMDLGVYSIYNPNPSDPAQNYAQVFLAKTSPEMILNRYYLVNRNDNQAGLYNGPNGYHNWGGNTPIQNLVDDYRMADGSKFDWNNPVHAAAPYANRDPRFYASILHDGAKWRERPTDVKDLDPEGIIQTFSELKKPDGSVDYGLDTRKGPIEDWNGSYTGYYIRKMVDPAVNHQFNSQEVPWPYFRYAEILLNYAEASIELNELGDAVDALNQIRRRAGMPEFTTALGQDQLREEYRNERRVEMVFEDQRFFDVRRWMIAPTVLNVDGKGINISLEGANRIDRSTWKNYKYEVKTIQDRAWDDKLYFMPITYEEMNRNSKLKQNPGY